MLAWLRTAPDAATMAGHSATAEVERKSRWQQKNEDKEAIELPRINAGAYLVDYLMEIGPALDSGMGQLVITFGEIDAWQRLTGVQLPPWQVRLMRHLSREWIAETARARDRFCPPPWMSAPSADSRARVAAQLRSVLGSRAKEKESHAGDRPEKQHGAAEPEH